VKRAPVAKASQPAVKRAVSPAPRTRTYKVERVQTGLRIEKRILKVLKAMAEYHDVSLGDLIEGIVLHAFEGKSAFGAQSLQHILSLKQVYGLDLDADSSHRLVEPD
jgi:hypothetical protein